MNIRRANINDFQAMAELWWELNNFNSKYDKEYYATKPKDECIDYKINYYEKVIDDPNHLIWVVEDEEIVFGYVYVELVERPPIFKYNRFARIQEASINPVYQKQGVFRNMFKIIIEELLKNDILLVDLEIDLDNPAQMAYWKVQFYKRLIHMICWLDADNIKRVTLKSH